jgi:Na+/H+ antiporter NhaA
MELKREVLEGELAQLNNVIIPGLGAIGGTGILCGIGFTMSMFIGSLAFEETGTNLLFDERLGIIVGSLLSGLVGYLVLRFSLPDKRVSPPI